MIALLAFIDDGVIISLISSSVAKKLNALMHKAKVSISGIAGERASLTSNFQTNLKVISESGDYLIKNLIVIDILSLPR